jgi:hypothetical protein
MHPTLIRQLAADRIRGIHAKAADQRRARQGRLARRHVPSTPPRLPASATLGYDDPRLDADRQSANAQAAHSTASAGDGQLAAR